MECPTRTRPLISADTECWTCKGMWVVNKPDGQQDKGVLSETE
jgi:hypothetical protein